MLVLGIDTSTSVCALALYDGQKVLSEWQVDNGFTHSEKMMPQLETLLASSNTEKKQIQGISVSMGPGSFTGLRIGLASAKAMAYAWGIPVCGVSTLQALAYNLPLPGFILSPLIDGQKGKVYQALYTWQEGKLVEIRGIEHLIYEQALQALATCNQPCYLLGEQIEAASVLPAHVQLAPAHLRLPRAASVAMLGYERLQAGQSDDVFTLEPYYMKKSEAELLWEKKNKHM